MISYAGLVVKRERAEMEWCGKAQETSGHDMMDLENVILRYGNRSDARYAEGGTFLGCRAKLKDGSEEIGPRLVA